jgi:hypothetical protein
VSQTCTLRNVTRMKSWTDFKMTEPQVLTPKTAYDENQTSSPVSKTIIKLKVISGMPNQPLVAPRVWRDNENATKYAAFLMFCY